MLKNLFFAPPGAPRGAPMARRVAQQFQRFSLRHPARHRRAYGAPGGAKIEIFEMSKIMKKLKNSFNKRFT